MSCYVCGECRTDRCDHCRSAICEQHASKRGNLVYCPVCLPWCERVDRWSATRAIARRVTPRFAHYAAVDELTRLESLGWTKADFVRALNDLLCPLNEHGVTVNN